MKELIPGHSYGGFADQSTRILYGDVPSGTAAGRRIFRMTIIFAADLGDSSVA